MKVGEGPALRGREVLWMADNTAALGGVVKGTSGQPILSAWSHFSGSCRIASESTSGLNTWTAIVTGAMASVGCLRLTHSRQPMISSLLQWNLRSLGY